MDSNQKSAWARIWPILISALFAGSMIGLLASAHHRLKSAYLEQTAPPSDCQHVWCKWDEPTQTQTWDGGVQFWQSRKCAICFYVQVKQLGR